MAGSQLITGDGGRVLLLSMRRVARLVGYCIDYEFEDVVGELTGADRVEIDNFPELARSRSLYRFTHRLTRTGRRGGALAGRHTRVPLVRDYELFFPVFNHPYELFALAAVPAWRQHCRYAACFLSELWLHRFPHYLLELLVPFDHVFLGVRHPIEQLARFIDRPCSYLPLGVDVPRFAPYPDAPPRTIDVCNIGRRSSVTHEALLKLAAGERRFFYYYDSVAPSGTALRQRTFSVEDQREHRLLLASLLQRSRFCFAHRAFINDPASTNGYEEISSRVYEAAAAGVVMLGEAPRGGDFRQQFDWPDALIPAPFDCPDIGRIIAELDADPARLERIRHDNIRHAALRHDWLYRLRTVFDTLGLPAAEGMLRRERQLASIADAVGARTARRLRRHPA